MSALKEFAPRFWGYCWVAGQVTEVFTLLLFQMNKIIKSGGGTPDDFEKSIGQAILELEMNSELKPQLRDLHITRAREIEFNNKKVCALGPCQWIQFDSN